MSTNRIFISRHVVFDEGSFPLSSSPPSPSDLAFLDSEHEVSVFPIGPSANRAGTHAGDSSVAAPPPSAPAEPPPAPRAAPCTTSPPAPRAVTAPVLLPFAPRAATVPAPPSSPAPRAATVLVPPPYPAPRAATVPVPLSSPAPRAATVPAPPPTTAATVPAPPLSPAPRAATVPAPPTSSSAPRTVASRPLVAPLAHTYMRRPRPPVASASPAPPAALVASASPTTPAAPVVSAPPVLPRGAVPIPPVANQHAMATRGKLGFRQPAALHASVPPSPVSSLPKSYHAALADPNWRRAMKEEFSTLMTNNTWSLVPRPPGANIVTGKWIFRVKYNVDGSLDRYKDRWVL